MSLWTEIKDQAGINNLLNLFGYFRNSCLRDVYISSREYVDKGLQVQNENRIEASLLFQRGSDKEGVLELRFEEVERFNFLPCSKDENTIIFDTALKFRNGLIYWADFADWEMDDNNSIWISGKRLFWRFRPGLTGNIKRLEIN